MRNLRCFIQRTFLFFMFASVLQVANAQMSLQLTPSNYNGYNISCFGGQNGSIDLTVTGGTTPYTYLWSNEATTEDLSNLAAGYYSVRVTDANSNTAQAQITLTQPQAFGLRLEASEYTLNGNTFNISCAICYDGSITSETTNGITPFTYEWDNSSTTQNISGLYEGTYKLTVTDDNGCTDEETIYLDAPERTDWQMSGNTGSNPPTHFIGTTDAKDLSFKTNNAEALRITSGGKVKINSLIDNINYSTVLVDENGQLLRVNPGTETDEEKISALPWILGGNTIGTGSTFLGTRDEKALIFKTNSDNATSGGERMRITSGGKVGIGTNAPTQRFEVSHKDEAGGVAINRKYDATDPSKKSEIKFNYDGVEKWAIGNDFDGDGKQTFFIWDHANTSARLIINEKGKVGIGGVIPPVNNSAYKLYVNDGIVARDIKVTAATTFPDYVFEKDYQPISIYELEYFIKQNKHLPEIPSAKEVEKNEGFEVGDLQIKLLKKIEEQTLYIIDLQKQVDELKKQVSKK